MVPCIEPFPIMFLPVSLKDIVPVIVLPACVRFQASFSWPVLSDDVPAQLPPKLLTLVDGLGEAGDDELPPHAAARRPTRTKAYFVTFTSSCLPQDKFTAPQTIRSPGSPVRPERVFVWGR